MASAAAENNSSNIKNILGQIQENVGYIRQMLNNSTGYTRRQQRNRPLALEQLSTTVRSPDIYRQIPPSINDVMPAINAMMGQLKSLKQMTKTTITGAKKTYDARGEEGYSSSFGEGVSMEQLCQ